MATGSDPDTSHDHPFPQTLEVEHSEASPSPSKRPKTVSLTLKSSRSPSPSSSSKGKSKIADESERECCGICLSEEGKTSRGWIDSCDHYFCFVCIMEWAKVESRCPMCKRRFTTIRRPPKLGLFYSERIVNVPVRDQVYNGLSNATIGPSNRYMEVQCTVCLGASDESLLLLCDLCDSAAHTYCVGLGVTVPDGDWFCHDCTLLRDEHTESEVGHNCGSQTSFRNCKKVQLAEEHVSIRDIIGESDEFGNERPVTRTRLPSSIAPDVGRTSTELGARTLSRCRNVQVRIQALRENWNAFRIGSLSFSSSLSDKFNAAFEGRSDQQDCSSFSSLQSTSQKDSSRNILQNRGSYDVDRAWKMMNAAKSIGRNHGRAVSKNPVNKVNALKKAGKSSMMINTSNCEQLGNTDRGTCGLRNSHRSYSHEKNVDKYKYLTFQKAKQKGVTLTGNHNSHVRVLPNSSEFRESSSYRKVQTSVQVNKYHESRWNEPHKSLVHVPPNSSGLQVSLSSRKVQMSFQVDNHQESRGYIPQKTLSGATNVISTPAERSSLISSEISCGKQEVYVFSSCNSQKGMVKGLSDSKTIKADEAKSEIQSLVKLNLKLLTRDEKLEVDAFKEVARHATHSILAACGLERPKVGIRSFPSSVCCHAAEIQQLHRSTLMPTSCRECFFVFVKDVVSTIILERKG